MTAPVAIAIDQARELLDLMHEFRRDWATGLTPVKVAEVYGEDEGALAARVDDATAGDKGTATAGNYGTATAGKGTLIVRRWNGKRYKFSVAYVGEDGIEPNVPYRLNAEGNFVKVGG